MRHFQPGVRKNYLLNHLYLVFIGTAFSNNIWE